MSATPSGLFGPVKRILAPNTTLLKLLSPYKRDTNGASGQYLGATVNVSGTVIGFVRAVAGSVVVASTTPGRMPPTGEPTPGKLSAGPKLPLFGCVTGGPSCALKPGKPNCPCPGASLNVPADPPVNGNCTNGCLLSGRNTAVFAIVPTFGPDGASTIAAGLHKAAPQKSCEF